MLLHLSDLQNQNIHYILPDCDSRSTIMLQSKHFGLLLHLMFLIQTKFNTSQIFTAQNTILCNHISHYELRKINKQHNMWTDLAAMKTDKWYTVPCLWNNMIVSPADSKWRNQLSLLPIIVLQDLQFFKENFSLIWISQVERDIFHNVLF